MDSQRADGSLPRWTARTRGSDYKTRSRRDSIASITHGRRRRRHRCGRDDFMLRQRTVNGWPRTPHGNTLNGDAHACRRVCQYSLPRPSPLPRRCLRGEARIAYTLTRLQINIIVILTKYSIFDIGNNDYIKEQYSIHCRN